MAGPDGICSDAGARVKWRVLHRVHTGIFHWLENAAFPCCDFTLHGFDAITDVPHNFFFLKN